MICALKIKERKLVVEQGGDANRLRCRTLTMTINHTFQFWCAVTAEHIRTILTWIQRDTKATWYLMYILHFIRWFTPSFNSRTVQVVGSVVKSERHRPKSQEQVDLLRLALNSSRGKGLTQWCNCKAQKEKKNKKKTTFRLCSAIQDWVLFIQFGDMMTRERERVSRQSLPTPFTDSEYTLTIVSL